MGSLSTCGRKTRVSDFGIDRWFARLAEHGRWVVRPKARQPRSAVAICLRQRELCHELSGRPAAAGGLAGIFHGKLA